MVKTPVFQTGDEGSIPSARSSQPDLKFLSGYQFQRHLNHWTGAGLRGLDKTGNPMGLARLCRRRVLLWIGGCRTMC